MIDLFVMILDTAIYILACAIFGTFVIIPGMIIGKMWEHPAPRWPIFVATTLVGAVASGLLWGPETIPLF